MIRLAQLLLVLSAGGLWVASRLPWVSVTSFDGLGQPTASTLNGAAWSTALLPMAVLLLAAALAGLAVRGWVMRLVAVLVAVVCLTLGYLGISLIVMRDVGPRGADLAGVPVLTLVASERHLVGAVLTLVAACAALVAAVLMMRSAVSASHRADKYAAPGVSGAAAPAGLSERGIWDALDQGRDPTDTAVAELRTVESDNEGR